MPLPLVSAADLIQWSYWIVVGGSGIIGLIMAYLLLPARLQFLGRLRVRSDDGEGDARRGGAVTLASGTHGARMERVRDPTGEARRRYSGRRSGSSVDLRRTIRGDRDDHGDGDS